MNISEDQFKFFLHSLCVCVHMYMQCACPDDVHTHGSEINFRLPLFLRQCRSLTLEVTLALCCLLPALGSQVHSAARAFLMCMLGLQSWVLMFAQ